MSRTVYNIDWPDDVSPVTMELGAYRMSRDGFNTGFPAYEHMFNAAKLLFTEKQYALHPWVKRRMKIFCEHGWATWVGPGAVAKSTDAAMCVLLHWLSAPSRTTCVVCSTTVPMLEKRIFGELVRYYSLIPDAPGKYRRTENAIVLGDENSKNGIFGVAVLKGSTREALGNIIGLHNEYVVLIVDEMQATREAAVEAATNLSSSGKEFIFVGMGNPESRLDPLGRYSTPSAGWENVHPDTCGEGWETPYGWCEFFDGLKCPNVLEPGRWPFLLSQTAIDQTISRYGDESPQYWTQRRGFFPPEGLERTLFTPTLFSATGSLGHVVWRTGATPIAGLDPAFSSMGDRCVLQFGEWGEDTSRSMRLMLGDTTVIPLKTDSGEPISFLIARQVGDECRKRGVIPENLAIDCTGSQISLADLLDRELDGHVHRVNFGGKASDIPLAAGDQAPAKDRCRNRVTELWAALHEFVKCQLVRGVSEEMIQELCSRRLSGPLHPMQIETKTVYRQRLGTSPDVADANAVLIALLRERFGAVAAPADGTGGGDARTYDDLCRKMDVDSSAQLYLSTWGL